MESVSLHPIHHMRTRQRARAGGGGSRPDKRQVPTVPVDPYPATSPLRLEQDHPEHLPAAQTPSAKPRQFPTRAQLRQAQAQLEAQAPSAKPRQFPTRAQHRQAQAQLEAQAQLDAQATAVQLPPAQPPSLPAPPALTPPTPAPLVQPQQAHTPAARPGPVQRFQATIRLVQVRLAGLRPMRHARLKLKEYTWKTVLKETAIAVAVVLSVSWVMNASLVRSFSIPTASMYPSLHVEDRVVVSQLVPQHFPIQRGDIVVFSDPGGWLPANWPPQQHTGGDQVLRNILTSLGIIPNSDGAYVIKRVIGLPGDAVVCCDAAGLLTINGVALEESYLPLGLEASSFPFEALVPDNMLFVLGDNRMHSADSRSIVAGTAHRFIPIDNVVGSAMAIAWPPSRIQWVRRPDEFNDLP